MRFTGGLVSILVGTAVGAVGCSVSFRASGTGADGDGGVVSERPTWRAEPLCPQAERVDLDGDGVPFFEERTVVLEALVGERQAVHVFAGGFPELLAVQRCVSDAGERCRDVVIAVDDLGVHEIDAPLRPWRLDGDARVLSWSVVPHVSAGTGWLLRWGLVAAEYREEVAWQVWSVRCGEASLRLEAVGALVAEPVLLPAGPDAAVLLLDRDATSAGPSEARVVSAGGPTGDERLLRPVVGVQERPSHHRLRVADGGVESLWVVAMGGLERVASGRRIVERGPWVCAEQDRGTPVLSELDPSGAVSRTGAFPSGPGLDCMAGMRDVDGVIVLDGPDDATDWLGRWDARGGAIQWTPLPFLSDRLSDVVPAGDALFLRQWGRVDGDRVWHVTPDREPRVVLATDSWVQLHSLAGRAVAHDGPAERVVLFTNDGAIESRWRGVPSFDARSFDLPPLFTLGDGQLRAFLPDQRTIANLVIGRETPVPVIGEVDDGGIVWVGDDRPRLLEVERRDGDELLSLGPDGSVATVLTGGRVATVPTRTRPAGAAYFPFVHWRPTSAPDYHLVRIRPTLDGVDEALPVRIDNHHVDEDGRSWLYYEGRRSDAGVREGGGIWRVVGQRLVPRVRGRATSLWNDATSSLWDTATGPVVCKLGAGCDSWPGGEADGLGYRPRPRVEGALPLGPSSGRDARLHAVFREDGADDGRVVLWRSWLEP